MTPARPWPGVHVATALPPGVAAYGPTDPFPAGFLP